MAARTGHVIPSFVPRKSWTRWCKMVCPKIASLEVVELGLGHGHSDFFSLDSCCVTWDQKKCYFLRSLNWPPGTWTNRTFYSWDQVTYVKQIQPDTPGSVISCSHPLPIFLGFRQIFLKVLFKTWNILTKKKRKKKKYIDQLWVSLTPFRDPHSQQTGCF